MFGGGEDNASGLNKYKKTVDAYSASLTRTTPTSLSQARYQLSAAGLEDHAVFAGGQFRDSDNGLLISAAADDYDENLIHTTLTDLWLPCRGPATTVVGDYILFGGGHSGYTDTAVVSAYMLG